MDFSNYRGKITVNKDYGTVASDKTRSSFVVLSLLAWSIQKLKVLPFIRANVPIGPIEAEISVPAIRETGCKNDLMIRGKRLHIVNESISLYNSCMTE